VAVANHAGNAIINYAGNARYFRPTSYKPGIIMIVVGVLILLAGRSDLVIIGLLLGGGGAGYIYWQSVDRLTDSDIDRQLDSIRSELIPWALGKLGLDRDEVSLINPFVMTGYHFDSLGSQHKVKVRKGKDGKFRSNICEGVAIFFAEQELHAYKYRASLTVENESSEQTDVYFYRDVVSVSTSSESVPLSVIGEAKPQAVKSELLELTTSGGTTVECSVSATENVLDREIQGARQLIRDKKMHTS
jgi:hypothetical protein